MKQATIYDISLRAGVSTATVSRVLNDSSKVSPKTRKKVLKVIEELEYEPNIFARGLGTGSTRTIGIMCADVADIYLANAVSFLERELRYGKFESALCCTGYEYEDKVNGLRNLESRKVDAVIMVGSHYIEDTARKNQYIIDTAKRVPVMMLNGYLRGDNIYGSLCDDYTAFYEATERMIKRGCSKIGFLFREETHSCNLKMAGYLDAIKQYNMEADEDLLIQTTARIQKIKNDLKKYFAKKPMVDALLACDDELAIGALKYFQENSIAVPGEVSIIGCNNSVLSICCEPELTSIDNMCEDMCVDLVNKLMRVLDQKKVTSKSLISCEYVERGTTRKRQR